MKKQKIDKNSQQKKDINEPQNVFISGDTNYEQRKKINLGGMFANGDTHADNIKNKSKIKYSTKKNSTLGLESPLFPSKTKGSNAYLWSNAYRLYIDTPSWLKLYKTYQNRMFKEQKFVNEHIKCNMNKSLAGLEQQDGIK